MTYIQSLKDRALRKLILTGGRPGIWGTVGRWAGTAGLFRLKSGPRMIIDRPDEYIQQCILYHGLYEPEINELLALGLSPGQLFIDVGANIGQHTLTAAYRGAVVHAFEPLPRLAQRLHKSIRLNRLEHRAFVFEYALSSLSGSASFYEADRADDGSHSLISGVDASATHAIVVKTRTLDSHLADSGAVPAMIKIDVEGAEALVLDGAVHTLAVSRPAVIVETGDRLADRINECAESVLSRIVNADYALFRINHSGALLSATTLGETTGELANYLGLARDSALLSTVKRMGYC